MTNEEARGYMILAAKRIGMSDEKIWKIDHFMMLEMDDKTEAEAKEAWMSI